MWACRILMGLVLGLVSAVATDAQTTAASPPPKSGFDVVAIKPCKPGDVPILGSRGGGAGRTNWSPGRLNVECQTIDQLIRDAYLRYADGKPWPVVIPGHKFAPISERLAAQPMKGSPPWIRSSLYTIDARTESAAGEEMMRGPMLQALLEDRFKLKIHHEVITVPVYELTATGGGVGLQAAKKGSCFTVDQDHRQGLQESAAPALSALPCGLFVPSRGNEGFDANGTSIAGLCRNLSIVLDRDVIDKTGIAGLFDIHLDLYWERSAPIGTPGEDAVSGPAALPDPSEMFAGMKKALQKLGLKLEAGKQSDEAVVIDGVERPAEN
jgi:uncharacterized protein (TIGR03435 family)